MIRIALCSGRRLFRDALAGCLGTRPDCVVVGNVADLGHLAVLCGLRRPDAVLIDIGDGIGVDDEVLRCLRECVAAARVVVVYERLTSAELGMLWQLGVDTLLPSSHGFDALLVVLRRLTAAEHLTPPRAGTGGRFSELDEKIISLLSAGHTVDRIAQLLEISAAAVANAKRRIYRKLAVASQSQAVARAAALGITGRSPLGPSAPGTVPGASALPGSGTLVAALLGPDGPARDTVADALLTGGIPVVIGVEAVASLVVLVDPGAADWPTGREAGLPLAVVHSEPLRRTDVLQALLRGAVAVVSAERVATELVPALGLARRGYLTVGPSAAATLLDAVRSGPVLGLPELTSRESQILRSIADGHTVRQTARAIGIAEKTVENTQARLFRKLGAHNRAGALAAAHALGLVDLVPTPREPVH